MAKPFSVAAVLVAGAILIGLCFPDPPKNQRAYESAKAEEQKPEPTDEDRKAATDEVLAFYTLWLMIFTGALAVSTIGLWIVTWRGSIGQSRDMKTSLTHAETAANAAAGQAQLARDTLIASQRAWLKTDVFLADEPSVLDAFGLRISFVFQIKNVGNVPAEKVIPILWLYPQTPLTPKDFFQSECRRLRTAENGFEQLVFPGDFVGGEIPRNIGFKASLIVPREDLKRAIGSFGGTTQINIYLMTLVNYRFASDKERICQTSVMKWITGFDPALLNDPGGPHEIPVGTIRFVDVGTVWSAAD